ncbi:acetoacetyl-CoA synthetase-like [Argiope bruennichi]|uniref:acetoacetyl-CoA synthetase-like n=1 Tax=Argiope bruennichi TaxID=94029 RepID=UPI00249581D6|nr:acetoacetyl-CoA synthetase-like [Argiope bruennichi]
MDCIKNTNLIQNGVKDPRIKTHFVVWNKKIESETGLQRFQKIIENKYNIKFESYWDFHKWSIEKFPDFWKEMWNFFDIIASKPYDKVFRKTGATIIDNEWFCGATLNMAETILRIRDNRVALSYSDEFENKGKLTFAEMFEKVKLFASAFRKHGLCKGDRIAGYISNIKEALFAFLAALSIGAIWGAAMPYLGPKAVSNMMKVIEPKFIIVADYFLFHEEEFFPVENLTTVTEGLRNLEKIIIVPQTENTNFSSIPKGILLEDFLESGRLSDGFVPDLVFEQLPPSHPASINFTSGTTGIPKGVVHSQVALLGLMRDYVLHLNLKNGDVIGNYSPAGWAAWICPIPSLALGVKQFLFNGSPSYRGKGRNFWDHLSENEVTYIFISAGDVNEMEEVNIVPGPNTNLDCLKIVSMSSSPPKPRNYNFLLNKVKKDLYVGCMYGATEFLATLSANNFNMPAYACESQIPALGVDLHCFDSKGNSIVGQRGEMVITTPTPSFPIYLWGDKNNERMRESYFNKYGTGVWCQNDEGYFNPETKGFAIIGRSDTVLKQYGERLSPDDIYGAIDHIKELQDYICVCQDYICDDPRNILFVQLKKGCVFTPELKKKIEQSIQQELSATGVPEVIMEVPGIPRNINNKRLESIVKKIVMTNTIPQVMNIRNPDCLKYFCDIPEILNYK